MYHFILKELMKNHCIKWSSLPEEIFKENDIQEMKNLCLPSKLNSEILEIESLPEYAKSVQSKFDPQSPFCLMIDDFCVKSENLWQSVGAGLIEAIKIPSKAKGAMQILVVCGAHDHPKRKFLREQNLSIASEWFVGGVA
jgi:hypothetical protein